MQWNYRKNWSPTPHLTRPKGLLVPIFWCQISQDTLTGPLSMSWKVRAVLMAWEGPMQYPGDLNVAVTYTRWENCRQCQAIGQSRSLISGSVCSVWSMLHHQCVNGVPIPKLDYITFPLIYECVWIGECEIGTLRRQTWAMYECKSIYHMFKMSRALAPHLKSEVKVLLMQNGSFNC